MHSAFAVIGHEQATVAQREEVFISYSREDKARVLELVAKLRQLGVGIWIDQGGIEGAGRSHNVAREVMLVCVRIVPPQATEGSVDETWSGKVPESTAAPAIDHAFVPGALAALRQAVEAGYSSFSWMANDPDLVPLRDHPEFIAIMQAT